MNFKILVSTLLLPICLVAQNKGNEIKEIIREYFPSDGPGVAVIVTQNQKQLYNNSFGLSDISKGTKIQTEELFRIGSITKQFTATAILKLAHEEKLNLDDPIEKYISIDTLDTKITIRQLLQHTSGLGNQSDVADFGNDNIELSDYPRNMLKSIINSPLKFSPGAQYTYSNLGYIVLGYIIERVSGMSYESYLKNTFFQPLKMHNTGFEYLDDLMVPTTRGYSMVDEEFEEAAPINTKIAFSAGAIVSNLQDLAKWNKAIMTGKILSINYVHQIQEANILSDGNSTGYSFGWQIGNIQGLKTVKHDGIINGFTSMAIYIPDADLFVSLLSNCDCFRDIELPTSKVAALFLDRPFPTKSTSLSENELKIFQGRFGNGDSEMIIAAHDSLLMYYRAGGDKRVLIPVGKNTFQIEGGLDQIFFDFKEHESTYTHMSLNEISQWTKTEDIDAYQSLSLDAGKLSEYIGKYQVPGAFVFEVIRTGDKLYGQIGNERKEIFCFENDKFVARYTDALLEFIRDQEGKIRKLNLNMGREITAERID